MELETTWSGGGFSWPFYMQHYNDIRCYPIHVKYTDPSSSSTEQYDNTGYNYANAPVSANPSQELTTASSNTFYYDFSFDMRTGIASWYTGNITDLQEVDWEVDSHFSITDPSNVTTSHTITTAAIWTP